VRVAITWRRSDARKADPVQYTLNKHYTRILFFQGGLMNIWP